MVASIATCSGGRSICVQRPFDDAIAFLVGVDQQAIVDDIRGNFHIGQKRRRLRLMRNRSTAVTARPGRWAGHPLPAKAGIKTRSVATLTGFAMIRSPLIAGAVAAAGWAPSVGWLLLDATTPLPGLSWFFGVSKPLLLVRRP